MPYRNPADDTRQSKKYREARREALGQAAPFVKPMVTLKVKGQAHGLRIAVITDCQVKPGVPLAHLEWCGKYLAKKLPDVIVQIGDFGDMSSLSSHDDTGSLKFEGRRYRKDLDAIHRGMDLLMNPIKAVAGWNPELIETLGNHEDRVTRIVNSDKKLEGFMSLADLKYEEYGWKVYPFLQPVTVGGVAFCHYFPSGIMGHPITSAKNILTKLHMSAFAGHQQGRDIAYAKRADGQDMTAIISGCLTPDHKVLMSDLKYVPLDKLCVGDKVVSFDAEAPPRKRRFKTGTVVNLARDISDVYQVKLVSGKKFKVTLDHQWLVRQGTAYVWRTTESLRKGTRIPKFFDEWETLTSYDAGWLSGMYDGEGSLYSRTTTGGCCMQLAISQKEGPTLDKIERTILDLFGYDSTSTNTSDNVKQLRIKGGTTRIASVLGQLRPERLLAKFKPEQLGAICSRDSDDDIVESILAIGRQEIVRSEIDTGTYIVEGYPHHNSFYQHNEDYLSPFTNNHWRGMYFLHEVKNGAFDEMAVSIKYLKRRFAK